MKLIPLLKILAMKPTVSPVIPPPTDMTKSDRLKFSLDSMFKQ